MKNHSQLVQGLILWAAVAIICGMGLHVYFTDPVERIPELREVVK
jgi:hypothetical protein